ncbi:hypothetical protein IM697_23370 [Streptomyces ferrugineus]|uniref:Uncharacterized protein n=1 Tax=Streptomyces ferrugineus TaxID=1413221 RepID=A0A7M2SAA7_9ACTN|nr:hypothetical protein [Streptomyces ferrugineus]QOV33192.1 hypothetical protein IM697_23370 [Streptomyces ferrugineus]
MEPDGQPYDVRVVGVLGRHVDVVQDAGALALGHGFRFEIIPMPGAACPDIPQA